MLRLIAMVTVPPELVDEAIRRARAMLADEPNVLDAEVGACGELRAGLPPAASFVVTATFTDRDAFDRYSTGAPHGALFDWIGPHMQQESAAVYNIDRAKTSA
jgi:hypothetical protein